MAARDWPYGKPFTIDNLTHSTYSVFIAGMRAAQNGNGRNIYRANTDVHKAWQLGWQIGLRSAGAVVI